MTDEEQSLLNSFKNSISAIWFSNRHRPTTIISIYQKSVDSQFYYRIETEENFHIPEKSSVFSNLSVRFNNIQETIEYIEDRYGEEIFGKIIFIKTEKINISFDKKSGEYIVSIKDAVVNHMFETFRAFKTFDEAYNFAEQSYTIED